MSRDIIDSQGGLIDQETDSNALEVLQTILPHFPDDERMANYLCYIASGWTRSQALIRAGAMPSDREVWRLDSSFREIDDAGYSELRRTVADAYAERLVRRNTIQWLEYDSLLIETARQKFESGEELTKDERAILLKRANYSVESLNVVNKLMKSNEQSSDSSVEDELEGYVDIRAFVMRRRSPH